MKPIIGLIPLYDDEKESYWMLPGYMKALEKCGALPVMLPMVDGKEDCQELMQHIDGLLLTGGHDVDPDVYNEATSDKCGTVCKARDKMEAILLDMFLKEDKPVFGICRGIQFMNAYLGGTLYQDIPTEYKSQVSHVMVKPYDRPVHKVHVLENTVLSDIIGAGEYPVNSYHHQAIKDLSSELNVLARAEDGLVEAVSVKGKNFAMAVQWHPEFSYETDSKALKLIQAFVDACK